jgi:hypothetical protein
MQPPPTASDAWYEARGGSFTDPISPSLLWDWTPVPARWSDANIGFRCVQDPQ